MSDLKNWLEHTRKIVVEGKELYDSPEEVLEHCEKKGLIISYPDTFKRVYKIGEVEQ